jgi:hypothetical protein
LNEQGAEDSNFTELLLIENGKPSDKWLCIACHLVDGTLLIPCCFQVNFMQLADMMVRIT